MTSPDFFIHESAQIAETAKIGSRVILDGPGIEICADAMIGSGSLIASNVVIGSGAYVKPGSVVFSNVPPHAVVQGNPAKVIGYTKSDSLYGTTPKAILNSSLFTEKKAPASISLGVKNCTFHLLRSYQDSRGNLAVGEVPSELPFMPQRYFIVYNVPSSQLRGEHAHKLCHQFLICISGSVRVLVDDGIHRSEVILDSPDLGLYMPAKTWGTQYNYTESSAMLVFASLPYDSDDYIRDYDEFLNHLKTL